MDTSHIWSFHGEREMKKYCLKCVCFHQQSQCRNIHHCHTFTIPWKKKICEVVCLSGVNKRKQLFNQELKTFLQISSNEGRECGS